MTRCRSALHTLFLLLLTTLVHADDEQDYRASIDKIGGEITKISRNLNANKKLLKTEQDKLFEIEQSLVELNKKITKTNSTLTATQSKINALDQEIESARQAQSANRIALKRLLESRYKTGKRDYVKRFLNLQNPYEVGRLNNYHHYFSVALRTRFEELEQQIQVSQTLHTDHQRAMSELVREREQLATLKQQQQAAKNSRAKSVAKLNQKVGDSQTKLEKLKKDRARLNSLLEQIAKQAAELRRIEAQREKERQQQQVENQSRTEPVVRTPVRGGFLKQKGRLSYPVESRPTTMFGNRLPESGMRSQGLFFTTNGSQPVRTIFRGRVLFADFLKGYGLLMIVDHGDEHISLYGHNELLYKRVGDTVETNEIIAKTGVTGGLRSTGLYFEVRNNATPVDPAVWCK